MSLELQEELAERYARHRADKLDRANAALEGTLIVFGVVLLSLSVLAAMAMLLVVFVD